MSLFVVAGIASAVGTLLGLYLGYQCGWRDCRRESVCEQAASAVDHVRRALVSGDELLYPEVCRREGSA